MGLLSYIKNLYYDNRLQKAETRLAEGRKDDAESILSSILDKHPLAAAKLADYYFSLSESAAAGTVASLYEKVVQIEGKGGQVYDAKAYNEVLAAFAAKMYSTAEALYNTASYADVSLLLSAINKSKCSSEKSLNLCCRADINIVIARILKEGFSTRGFLNLLDSLKALWVRGRNIPEVKPDIKRLCDTLRSARRYYAVSCVLAIVYGNKYHASCLDSLAKAVNGEDSEVNSGTIKEIVKKYGKRLVLREGQSLEDAVSLFHRAWEQSHDCAFAIDTIGPDASAVIRDAIVAFILSHHEAYLTDSAFYNEFVQWAERSYDPADSIRLYEKIYRAGYEIERYYVNSVHRLCMSKACPDRLPYLDKAQSMYPASAAILKDKLDCAKWFESQGDNAKAIEISESIIPNCIEAKVVKAKALCNIANKETDADGVARYAEMAVSELNNISADGSDAVREYVYRTYQSAAEKYYEAGAPDKCYAILHELSKCGYQNALLSIAGHRLDEVRKCSDTVRRRAAAASAIDEVCVYGAACLPSAGVYQDLWSEKINAVLDICKAVDHKQAVAECENLKAQVENEGFDSAYAKEKLELLRQCIIQNKYAIARELEKSQEYKNALSLYKEINAIENKRTPTLSALRFILCILKSQSSEEILRRKDKIHSILSSAANAYKSEKEDIAYRLALLLLKSGEENEAMEVLTQYLPEEVQLKKACEQAAMIKAQAKLDDFNQKLEAVHNRTLPADDALYFINHLLEYAEVIRPILDIPRAELVKYRDNLKHYAIVKLFDECKFAVAFEKLIKEHPDYLEDLTALRNIAVVCLNIVESNQLTKSNYKEVISIWLTAIYQESLFVKSLDYTSWDNQYKFTLQNAYGHFDECDYDELPENVTFEDPEENAIVSIMEVQRSLLDRFEAAVSDTQVYHEFFNAQKDAMDAMIALNLDVKCTIIAPYLMSKDEKVAREILEALEHDQKEHYGNWEALLGVGVAYEINRPIYRDYADARKYAADCRSALENMSDLAVFKQMFKSDKIQAIKNFDGLCSTLVSFASSKISALKSEDASMFKSNFDCCLIVCEALGDKTLSFIFANYVLGHVVDEVNGKRMKNAEASKYILPVYLIDPSNNRVKDNLKTLFEMLAVETTAASKQAVKSILDMVKACSPAFHSELKNAYDDAQVTVQLDAVYKKVKNGSMTTLAALETVHELYRKYPGNSGVCTLLAQLGLICIEEYIIGDKYGSYSVRNILNSISANESSEFRKQRHVFADRYRSIWNSLSDDIRFMIKYGVGTGGRTLNSKGVALKNGLEMLKDLGGVN